MVKISKIRLTHLVIATPQALRQGLVGAVPVSLPNTPMTSNIVVDTIQEHPKAEEMPIAWIKI